ncbi:DUF5719 family protein [Streptomyces capparidis]
MKRTTLTLIAVVAVFAALLGAAALTAPEPADTAGDAAPAAVRRMPVQQTTLTCPAPSSSDFADTTYTAYSAGAVDGDGGKASGGSAALRPAPGAKGDKGDKGDKEGADGKPVAPLTATGEPVTADTDDPRAPALTGTADGALAPGYTVQQTTEVSSGDGRGLYGTSCTAPGADFWFPGVSTAEGREDYAHLTNPDDTPAVADLELYGPEGRVETTAGEGVNVPPHATVPIRLSTLAGTEERDLALHVVARSGRVGAAVQAAHPELGGDWLPASAAPADSVVLPGLPKDTESARLVVFAPGDDADLKVELATPTSSIVPAGHETLRVKSGMVAVADLENITQGEAGSLVLTPSTPGDASPVVAGLELVRGKGDDRELAFLSATGPVKQQATVSGSEREDTTVFLTAPDEAAKVKVTSTAGGAPAEKTVEVRAGTTLALEPPEPSGKGPYAITVTPVSGGPVHAARMLDMPADGVAAFTVQPMPDDRATVPVPSSHEDISVVGRD